MMSGGTWDVRFGFCFGSVSVSVRAWFVRFGFCFGSVGFAPNRLLLSATLPRLIRSWIPRSGHLGVGVIVFARPKEPFGPLEKRRFAP